jgi:hypothetical protein
MHHAAQELVIRGCFHVLGVPRLSGFLPIMDCRTRSIARTFFKRRTETHTPGESANVPPSL